MIVCLDANIVIYLVEQNPSALPSPRLADHSRTCPSPKTIHLVLVSSRRPQGPRA